MDPSQRENLIDDLKGILKGELLFDDLSCALYSTDASIFQVRPLGVVVPRDEEDVRALVRYAAEHHVPLIGRGGGSGMAGESLGAGLIVDFCPHFRSILEIGADTVRVQPGVVHRDLNAELAKVGRRFAPDPASSAQCTIGGMLATNASGSRALRHGYTRDHVAGLRVVLDNGVAAAVGQELTRALPPLPDGASERSTRIREVVLSVATVLERNAELIRASQPRTPYNRCGYLLHDVLHGDRLDLARLLVGTEGTLCLFTEATLRTIPLPEGRAAVLLGFSGVETALRATRLALDTGPAACELVDRRLLTLARSGDDEIEQLVPAAVEAALLLEYESDDREGAGRAAAEVQEMVQRGEGQALLAVAARAPAEIDRLWRLRELALPSLYGLRGGAQPIPFVEDVGVPPENLADYLYRVQEILQRFETTASFFVHAATGQVHTRPFIDLRKPAEVEKLWPIAEAIHGLALELGGTVSTQHGTGLARTPWVERQYGRLHSVFKEIKAIFDPHNLLNPGKIIGPAPNLPAWPLRGSAAARSRKSVGAQEIESVGTASKERSSETAEAAANGTSRSALSRSHAPTHLHWQPGEIRAEAEHCNGCGQCRTLAPTQRMCPIFRATRAESAAPRAKANLLRHLLDEAADSKLLSSDAVREVADLCINCKDVVAHECPAHVNIPKLMLEAKAANTAEHGLDRFDWALSRTESFARFASAFAVLVNPLLRSRPARWLLEKLFGIARHRRLPRFSSRSFLRRAKRRGWTRKPEGERPRVAYFVDVFANYNDPSIAEAVVHVLHHNGVDVYVPPGQVGSGMAPLAYGDVEAAREAGQRNLRVLAELAREGFTILCSEPTAALMLRHDYLDLFDDADARLVADHTVELTAYLGDLHRQGRFRTDFQELPLSLGHHVPCHLKALGRQPEGPALLALIPGLRVFTIDVSCSGMAGTFGLRRDNHRTSLEAGRPMLEEMRRPGILFGSTECSTCRMQIEEGARKTTLHPAQYLALAYGLMPGLIHRLKR